MEVGSGNVGHVIPLLLRAHTLSSEGTQPEMAIAILIHVTPPVRTESIDDVRVHMRNRFQRKTPLSLRLIDTQMRIRVSLELRTTSDTHST